MYAWGTDELCAELCIFDPVTDMCACRVSHTAMKSHRIYKYDQFQNGYYILLIVFSRSETRLSPKQIDLAEGKFVSVWVM